MQTRRAERLGTRHLTPHIALPQNIGHALRVHVSLPEDASIDGMPPLLAVGQ